MSEDRKLPYCPLCRRRGGWKELESLDVVWYACCRERVLAFPMPEADDPLQAGGEVLSAALDRLADQIEKGHLIAATDPVGFIDIIVARVRGAARWKEVAKDYRDLYRHVYASRARIINDYREAEEKDEEEFTAEGAE